MGDVVRKGSIINSLQTTAHTRQHHLNKISFMDVFCRGQPLQDVLVVQVVAEQQDLVVHTKEATLWELKGDRNRIEVEILNKKRGHVKEESLEDND